MNLEEKLYRESLSLATIFSRFFAFWIDRFLVSLICILIFWDDFSQTLANSGGSFMASRNFVLLHWEDILILTIAYEIIFLMLYGATLGKIIFKIRVIDVSMLDSPSFLSALIRTIFKIIGMYLLFLPYLLFLYIPFRQTLHDFLAKTIVVKND